MTICGISIKKKKKKYPPSLLDCQTSKQFLPCLAKLEKKKKKKA